MASGVTIDINANTARFSSQIDKITSDLNKLTSNTDRMQRNMDRAFKGLTAAIPTGLFLNFVKGTIDAADGLNDMSQRTGVAVDILAGLKTAAEQSGSTVAELADGMRYLSRNMVAAQDGNAKMRATLEALGLTSANMEENFYRLADVFQKMPDGMQKSDLAMQLLGRTGDKLIPTLNNGGTALREMAAQSGGFAQAMAKLAPDADRFNDKIVELRNSLTGMAATALPSVINGIINLLNEMTIGIQTAGSFAESIRLFGFGISPFKTAQESLDKFANRMLVIQQQLDKAREKGDTKTQQSLEAERADIIKQITYLQKLEAAKNFKAPSSSSGGSFDSDAVSQAKCVAAGGVWDGKKCIKAKGGGKRDQLSSLIDSTDIGKLAEFDKTVALLNQRFDYGRKNVELYTQAMTKLIQTTFADRFKQAADDQEFMNMVMRDGQDTINESNAQWEEWQKTVKETEQGLIDMVSPVNALIRKLTELDKWDGVPGIDPEVLAAARLQIQGEIDDLNGLGKEAKKQDDIGKELGLTFSSAFEDAIVNGGKFRDVLAGIAKDIQRVIARKTITEPLGNAISGWVNGINWGSLFGFANGGVMTANGPRPLKTYSLGGIANSPQLAVWGEGKKPEAYVPLPDGRSIPVTMTGGSGGVVLNQNINIDARGADAGVEQRIRAAAAEGARQGYAMVLSDLSRGGPVARLTGAAS